MSHRGSLLLLPSGIYAWPVTAATGIGIGDLQRVLAEQPPVELLLLGTGDRLHRAERGLREAFAAAGIGLDSMETGAAVRTYNVLLAERRSIGAALIAVDRAR